jgi:hypothetical protein
MPAGLMLALTILALAHRPLFPVMHPLSTLNPGA